jgi:hypothetical protein
VCSHAGNCIASRGRMSSALSYMAHAPRKIDGGGFLC